jgi:hypothetical protein
MDRRGRATVGARRTSFGASSSGWKEVERPSERQDANEKKKHTARRDTVSPTNSWWGEKRTHTGAARVSHLLERGYQQEQQHHLVMQRGAIRHAAENGDAHS